MEDDEVWAPARPDALAQAVGLDVDPAPSPPVTSVSVPGYTDLVEIARGGDGLVLRARDAGVDRDVAIKVVDLAEPEVRARFEREVAITVRLGRAHPNIVTVLATPTTTDGRPCLVMDFHDLGSLHDRLRSHGPLPVAEVVSAGTALADALAYAHAQGVLHRDVKPQNVLVLPTSFVLADFGIARAVDAGRTSSLERFSYRHASPQVLDGLTPTPADDVWSLGSTLFTLLDGRAPFAADDPDEDTALAYLRKVRTGARRTLARSDVPPSLASLLDACLAPEPADRPDGAAAVLRALRAVPTEVRGWEPGVAEAGAPVASAAPVVPTVPAPVPPRSPGTDDDDATRERPSSTGATGATGSTGATGATDPTGSPATPGATTAPRSPAPVAAAVARSTLSHLGRESEPPARDEGRRTARSRSDVADAAPTGLTPSPDEVAGRGADGGASGSDSPSEGSARPRTWRRTAAFVGAVLLVGAAIGVGPVLVDLVRGDGGESVTADGGTSPDTTNAPDPDTTGEDGEGPEGGEAETTGSVPVYGDVVPEGVVEAQTGNPDLAPTGVAAVDRGTSAEISWNLPAQEDVQLMVVSQVEGSPVHAYDLLAAGTTTFLADGLDPGARICFSVVGLGAVDGSFDRGASASRCLER
ncbi:serine/threonine-protein kinase [Serinibacter arcticus]|uniref:serine/threonine-protein kinase n=1 Tax=Serinibacter arcticus TaxID=1655435 RepID=UPI001304810B|nr:serine/threonine-protein kinase [Serinibacter arcticus]